MADLVSSSGVVDLIYDVAQEQLGRKKPFFENLSNTLKVAGEYQNWLSAHPTADLLQKVEECLNIWNDGIYGGAATRNDLIEMLQQNQRRMNCQPLILKLQGDATCSVSLATSSSANAEIQRQGQELLDTLTGFKIPQLYSKMIAANVTEDVLWDLSDKMLDDCELNDVEKLRYSRAKKAALQSTISDAPPKLSYDTTKAATFSIATEDKTKTDSTESRIESESEVASNLSSVRKLTQMFSGHSIEQPSASSCPLLKGPSATHLVSDTTKVPCTSRPSTSIVPSTSSVSTPSSAASSKAIKHVPSIPTSTAIDPSASTALTKSMATDLLKQDKNGWTGLMTAVIHKNIDQVQMILDQAKQLDILKDLIDKTEVERKSPLWVASGHGVNNICQLLLENKSDVNKSSKISSPLYVASQEGHATCVKTLLANKASIDQPAIDGSTPLIKASEKGHSRLVDILLQNGADPYKTRDSGGTAIYHAATSGRANVVELLLNKGFPIDHRSYKNLNILHAAMFRNQIEVAKCILKRDKNNQIVNDNRNNWKHSPLTVAIQQDGNLDMVKLLIDHGADPMMKGDGKSPLKWAQKKDKKDIVAYLQTIVCDKPKSKSVFSFMKK